MLDSILLKFITYTVHCTAKTQIQGSSAQNINIECAFYYWQILATTSGLDENLLNDADSFVWG